MAVTEAGLGASRELDSLYRRHGAEIYRYALAVLGNHSDAEDVTQTTFLNAYRALEQGVRPRKPSNWLLTIASNVIKQRFRQELSKPPHVALDRDLAGKEKDDDVPTVGEVLTALAQIPPQQRQALVLREFEGRSYKEIADILEITTSALETLLFRARRSLADELTNQLTCVEAQQAISRAADGRVGRKERRRLRQHLTECPDCAQFARLQQRHRRALRGLALVPIPLSLSVFKGLEGSAAAAAAIPVATGAAVATGGGGALASGAAATGGGVFAGGIAVKAAAVVAAASVAGGATVAGVKEIEKRTSDDKPPPARVTKTGKTVPVRNHGANASDRAQERRNAVARGRTGQLSPGLAKKSDTKADQRTEASKPKGGSANGNTKAPGNAGREKPLPQGARNGQTQREKQKKVDTTPVTNRGRGVGSGLTASTSGERPGQVKKDEAGSTSAETPSAKPTGKPDESPSNEK
jgi:RNA polymerase sigma factor (sigma-70 family)